MADLSKIEQPEMGTGILQPKCVKTEWLWHSHTDLTEEVIDCVTHWKPPVMVKYEINIYADRSCIINVIEEISDKEWFKRKLEGTLHGHWSLYPEIDK